MREKGHYIMIERTIYQGDMCPNSDTEIHKVNRAKRNKRQYNNS